MEVNVVDFNPKRHPTTNAPMVSYDDQKDRTSMHRFRFMVDGGVRMDGEISKDEKGFTILYNDCQNLSYLEDIAFHGEAWKMGKFVPFSFFNLAARYHVELSNYRASNSKEAYSIERK